ncbi:hypothetical protein CEXT_259931 [Caerostris extrusa]|uniref:Transposase n=1 Tax=Caerostris extrusa TaxID=172846 RepID=A0AAV4TPD1_CAEEX|nr:hypothetical protein CEXT_259931 [Caerostris extrusa]
MVYRVEQLIRLPREISIASIANRSVEMTDDLWAMAASIIAAAHTKVRKEKYGVIPGAWKIVLANQKWPNTVVSIKAKTESMTSN